MSWSGRFIYAQSSEPMEKKEMGRKGVRGREWKEEGKVQYQTVTRKSALWEAGHRFVRGIGKEAAKPSGFCTRQLIEIDMEMARKGFRIKC